MKIEIINEEYDPWQKLVEYKRAQLRDYTNIGACSVFLGTMRDINSGETIKAMELEHYPDMTENYLEKIVSSATKKYKIIERITKIIPKYNRLFLSLRYSINAMIYFLKLFI